MDPLPPTPDQVRGSSLPATRKGRVEGGEITLHDFAISPQVLREVC